MNVDVKEFKQIREKLAMTQKEMAHLLGYTGNAQTVKNIEGGSRNPGKLAIKLLRYLSSLPKSKAATLIEELNRHETD
jgi:DNA-binding transcriptional regulator YiaG